MGKAADLSELDKGQIVMAWHPRTSISETVCLVGCSHAAVVSTYRRTIVQPCVVHSSLMPEGSGDCCALFTATAGPQCNKSSAATTVVTKAMCHSTQFIVAFCVWACVADDPAGEGLEVEWRRTDSETFVHLYQDGESRPEAQQQEYHDRAHFFTDQIQHGNFSLRLDNLRAEDEGKYTCKVYIQEDSGETVVTLKSAERLLVSGSSRFISASVGEDVTLNCSVDSHIPPTDIEVSWKKTDEDEYIPVLLYQDHEALPEAAHERYRDRVEFFTDEIPKGNFSLRLKSVRTEDKGVYMCQVFAGGLSANATVVLERLGFSVSHIIVFILCISATGSALLLCFLIYCRSPYKGTNILILCSLFGT
ncbi:Butyrophilin-like protein 2 [Anabarilius grahami]|uniref:Butyrophilin-like protein 2 n=1 Tax=Anabarilius grahami TaxID=495550 RepID=A0A3N0Z556_ANAGA|nr:Butyrophilin-like protein 2 [Anabarilius grahami]